MYRTWLEISKDNLLHNLKEFLNLLKPETCFMAVVKANAYGHGLTLVAKLIAKNSEKTATQNARESALSNQALSSNDSGGGAGESCGVETNNQNKAIAQDGSECSLRATERLWFGVDSIDEALTLRKQGIKQHILTLGYVPLDRLQEAVVNNIRLTVYNCETIQTLIRINPHKSASRIKLHVKVETGTNRQGVLPEEIEDFCAFIQQYPHLEIEGFSSHFANIEDTTDHSYAFRQLDAYKRILERLERRGIKPKVNHIAASAASILFSETYFDMVRCGIALYGLWPSKETFVSAKEKKIKLELKPVLSWKTKIAQIKKIKAGQPVGYGLSEQINQDSRIAVLPVGYWDGYDRKLSSMGNVLIQGTRCRVLGRVAMNMIMVDVSHLSGIKIENEAILLGQQGQERITAEELANKIGTINYEVVTRINPLLPRVIV